MTPITLNPKLQEHLSDLYWFLFERCELGPDFTVDTDEIRDAYIKWRNQKNYPKKKSKSLSIEFTKHMSLFGFRLPRQERRWKGLRLK